MAPKNIVILCDGTSNEVSTNRTNVLRLYGVLKRDEEQLVFYDPGVGTFGAENAFSQTYRKAVEIAGLATGWGLDQNVKEAYRFIVENYEKSVDETTGEEVRDRIYLFGFSRGAYTARVLAGFIHAVGLMDRTQLNLLDYAYRAYKRVTDDTDDKDRDAAEVFEEVRLFERVLSPDRPPIRLLGLFDTVSSMIESGRYLPRLRWHAFTRRCTSVQAVRHAVAIDERRVMFRPQLWEPGGEYWGNPFNRSAAVPQDVAEVWFRGVHADVGGGYPETGRDHPESGGGLSKIPLLWMIEETAEMGLRYKSRTIDHIVRAKGAKAAKYDPPDPAGEIHDSMNFVWRLLEFAPQRARRPGEGLFGYRLPRGARRIIPEGASIHQSVYDRAKRLGEPLPENLPADAVSVADRSGPASSPDLV